MSLVKKSQHIDTILDSAPAPIMLDSASAEDSDMPEDYEVCDECGFDHGYNYEDAYLWHLKNSNTEEPPADPDEIFINEEDADPDFEDSLSDLSFEEDGVDLGDDDGLEEYGVADMGAENDFGDADDKDPEDGEVTILVKDEGEEPKVFKFDLPMIPGSDITEADDIDVDEEEDEVQVEEKDMWDWQSGGLAQFIPWLFGMFNNVPKHSGHDTAGIERVMAFLGNLNKIISKAVRSDLKGELDVGQLEQARHSINDGLYRCEQRLNRLNKKKKADFSDGTLIKEAQKITGVSGGVVVTVPLLISRLARVCINGMVSGGHDIEFMFNKLSEKYKLDNREQAELMQLIEDMGLAIPRDRGFRLDEEFGRTKQDGFDWNQNFYA